MTLTAIATGTRCAIVDIDLTARASETSCACAFEAVDKIVTCAAVQTWSFLAFVNVDFALGTGEPWHTDTSKCTRII